MLDNLSGFQTPSMPFSVPGTPPPSSTGQAGAPVSSPMAGPVAPSLLPFTGIDPSQLDYGIEKQLDGSLLIRVKFPDGSLGPVVQHIAAPKLKGMLPGQTGPQ